MRVVTQQSPALFDPFGYDVIGEKFFRFDIAYRIHCVLVICKRLKTAGLPREVRDKLFLMAVGFLEEVRSRPMSRAQLIQVNYAFALIDAADGEHAEALRRLEWVLGAIQGAHHARSEVLRLSGEMRHRGGDLGGAADDYLQSFTTMQYLDHVLCAKTGQVNTYVNPEAELDVVVRVCNIELERADVDHLDQHLKVARRLFEYVLTDVSSYKTRLAWVEAQRLRCRGEIDAARQHALTVAHDMSATPNAAFGRALVMLMDIILDQIDNQLLPDTRKRELLYETSAYAMRARHTFEDHPDAIGANLLEQTQCRADHLDRRMSGLPANLKTIEQTVEKAERLEDAAVIARAYTVLGAEQEMAGDLEHAKDSYQFADHRLRSHGFLALSAWPRAAIARLAQTRTISA